MHITMLFISIMMDENTPGTCEIHRNLALLLCKILVIFSRLFYIKYSALCKWMIHNIAFWIVIRSYNSNGKIHLIVLMFKNIPVYTYLLDGSALKNMERTCTPGAQVVLFIWIFVLKGITF